MQIRGDERKLIEQFTPLVGYVLAKTGITKRHIYYHDYQQELFIKLLTLARGYEGNPLGADRYKFTAYAKQGLTWHLIELLRKYQRQVSKEELHDIEPYPIGITDTQASQMELEELLTTIKAELTEEELQIVRWRYFHQGSMTELAQQMNISRRALYKKWEKLKDKLHGLFDKK